MKTIWEKCLEKCVVIAPVKLYSAYVDEEVSESKLIGVRYCCVSAGSNEIVVEKDGDVFIYVDDMETSLHKLYDTPEEAVDNY